MEASSAAGARDVLVRVITPPPERVEVVRMVTGVEEAGANELAGAEEGEEGKEERVRVERAPFEAMEIEMREEADATLAGSDQDDPFGVEENGDFTHR